MCITSGPGVSVMCLNLMVPWVDLKWLIVAFPGVVHFYFIFKASL